MTTTEAFYFTLEKVNELKSNEIDIEIKPSNNRKDVGIIEKYNGPERISPELWCHVSFTFKDNASADKILKTANYLGMCGISFDTGGMSGGRDWELDWSFKYTKGKENIEWINRGEELENILKFL